MTNNAKFLGLNTSYDFFYCLKTYLQARAVGDAGYELDIILFLDAAMILLNSSME